MKKIIIALFALMALEGWIVHAQNLRVPQDSAKTAVTVPEEVAKPETVYLPSEKGYENQIRFYDSVLKAFSVVIGLFTLVAVIAGFIGYRDRQAMQQDYEQRKKDLKELFDASLKLNQEKFDWQREKLEKQIEDSGKRLNERYDAFDKQITERSVAAEARLAGIEILCEEIKRVAAEKKVGIEKGAKDFSEYLEQSKAAFAEKMAPPPATAPQAKKDAVKAFNEGVDLYKKGNIEGAIAKYREAIRLKPGYAEAHNNLGMALGEKGETEEEIKEHREAIRLKPDDAEAHYNLGVALRQKGETDEEIKEYREAIRLKPDYAEAHNNLGNALKNQGKLDDAIEEYREAIRWKPDYALAHNNLGNALKDQGKLDDAIEEYREAIRWKPDYALAHKKLGNALKDQEKLDDAIEEYREAIRWMPDYALAHFDLGLALRKQGKLDNAIAEYRELIRLRPDLTEAHYNLACYCSLQGRKEEALQSLVQAVDNGFHNWPLMEKDEDLNNLRDDPRFKELAEKVKACWEEKQKKEGKGK